MRSFTAFTKKEILEQLRTYKALILLALLFVFGMISPLLAKLLPQLMAGMDMNGIKLELPTPVVGDAYTQFFKNMTQMGAIAVLLVFGGTLSGELTKGTLINVLAKGLHRRTVILSKYAAAVLLWSISFTVSAITNYGYSVYLFEDHTVHNLFLSLFCLWLFVCFVISLILLSGTIAGGSFGGLILSAVILLLLIMLNMIPAVKDYNPVTLASVNAGLVTGNIRSNEVFKAIWVTFVSLAAALFVSVRMFEKKKL